jgi:hypothetical protein
MLLIQTALVDPVDPEDWLVIAIYWIDKSPAVSRSVPFSSIGQPPVFSRNLSCWRLLGEPSKCRT